MTAINELSQLSVNELVPHRAPMILIDQIIKHSPNNLITQVHITTESPYYDAQTLGVPNYVGIEYMAQSIAALAGAEAKAKGEEIRIGFLLGSRKLVMDIPQYDLGQTYQVEVTRLYQEDSGLAVFDCYISHQGKQVSSANVNVFQPKDTKAYIAESLEGSGENNE